MVNAALTLRSKRLSYEAGMKAGSEGGPHTPVNGWGCRQSAYRPWYLDGFYDRPFKPMEPNLSYAEAKVLRLIDAEVKQTGLDDFTALRAFARYIDSRE